MRRLYATDTQAHYERALSWLSVLLLGFSLTGCDSGSSDPPPPQTPAPPPAPDVPPLAATAVSLDDGHTVGSAHWADSNTSDGGQGQPVGDLECVFPSPETYHVHTHLSVFMNGEAFAIPNAVGMVELSPTTECHYPLHTHNASGLIHVHAEAPTDFTLGEFFAIWGQPLEPDNVGGIVGIPAVVYITDDGVVSEYTGDFSEIDLMSHREITIQVGTPITEIPNYVWSGD